MAELELASGRRVECRAAADSTDELTIRGAGGEVLLEVTLTPEGPVLRFQGARVQLECPGDLKIRCGSFDVESSGDVSIRANDDVNLNGERVRLNC